MNDPTLSHYIQPPGNGKPAEVTVLTPSSEIAGRYRIEKILGQGGFGTVYLAVDLTLVRPVAIKVPHTSRVTSKEDATQYLDEARIVAKLDHPNIVPVYDVGSCEEFPCFIISKYIEGCTLSQKIKEKQLNLRDGVDLVVRVARALHFAHCKGLVHRDVKPSNILVDTAGRPYVADFGLARKEEDPDKGFAYVGTPAYMSPEQARGEGHRVDGRSDIFSVGIVLYEILSGRRPFHADSTEDLMDKIAYHEPRPLRHINQEVPKELERICFKSLAKRASERYMTADDLADELSQFLAEYTPVVRTSTVEKEKADPPDSFEKAPDSEGKTDTQPWIVQTSHGSNKIIPRGLRSFDSGDADFFLDLLPGPRDRTGLPDCLRFWKTRIESTDADHCFSVGLIYGPSGCGKSSLVKAGLLPRLNGRVISVYVEASQDQTEIRLLNGLRKRFPELPTDIDLRETLTTLRRGQGSSSRTKVLIVLDQFEQWLHAKREEPEAPLIQALRQCDGIHVQCIVMLRDDFWMAATRLMRELEIDLVPGQNLSAVDLFDNLHARKVLVSFGRAFGTLPDEPVELSKEQKLFVEKAVEGLTQEGKVISVRLALFAEMMKGKPWTVASLKQVGGTEGVGFTFLEETFSAPSANPKHRLHQTAARGVLRMLLPEAGSDIKGHMRSHAELRTASGYDGHPGEFEELIRVLDGEIRLITPIDPEGKSDAGKSVKNELSAVQDGSTQNVDSRHYQLTHDYLVHSLRDWLTLKQKQTRVGRTELILEDLSSVWNARPENRQLPSFSQWLAIRLLTRKKNWTEPQQKMMRNSNRYFATRGFFVAIYAAIIFSTVFYVRNRLVEKDQADHASRLVKNYYEVETSKVPDLLNEMVSHRNGTEPLLKLEDAKTDSHPQRLLRTSLALYHVDPSKGDYLFQRLLESEPEEVQVIAKILNRDQEGLLENLWKAAESPVAGQESCRLRAAGALAMYDPANERWSGIQVAVANDLVSVQAFYLSKWMELLKPVKVRLRYPLSDIFVDAKRGETERLLAANILESFAEESPELFVNLVVDAEEKQFLILYPRLRDQSTRYRNYLFERLDHPNSSQRQRANAAIALHRLGYPAKLWTMLDGESDATIRNLIINRCAGMGVESGVLARKLGETTDRASKRSLMLALGTYSKQGLVIAERDSVIEKTRKIYVEEADAGTHAAADWLLRQFKDDVWILKQNQVLSRSKTVRENRISEIQQAILAKRNEKMPYWLVNAEGQTMSVLPGPVEFKMGSPDTENGRSKYESLHLRRIPHSFTIASTPVTKEHFQRFLKTVEIDRIRGLAQNGPVHNVTWHDAAKYCNWLSEQEEIPKEQWCYIEEMVTINKEMVVRMRPKKNYLQLGGYRLPTEAEWEYACRAGSSTPRFYGEADQLIGNYVWYSNNSDNKSHSVGDLKPNDWGLFDMLGNVWTWCQDGYEEKYPITSSEKVVVDREGEASFNENSLRASRGGSYGEQITEVRSAYRMGSPPNMPYPFVGFRVVRTFR